MGNSFSKFNADANTDDCDPLEVPVPITTASSKYLWKSCPKHPGHPDFIPANDFRQRHLPKEYRNDTIMSYVDALCNLTVRVEVSYVSENRLDNDRLASLRGRNCTFTGTGMVREILDISGNSNNRKEDFHRVFISTACHVVYDSTEAAKTKVELFYNDESDRTNKKVKILQGSRVIQKSVSQDWCVFECVTRNNELIHRLKELREQFEGLEKEMMKKHRSQGTYLCIIASHPHGGPKKITVGVGNIVHPNVTRFPICDGDRVIFPLFPLELSPMVNKTGEAEMTDIEVTVRYPDGIEQKCHIWLLGRSVKETKIVFRDYGGFENIPEENLELEMELPGEVRQPMDDGELIDYYWNDLCESLYVDLKYRQNEQC